MRDSGNTIHLPSFLFQHIFHEEMPDGKLKPSNQKEDKEPPADPTPLQLIEEGITCISSPVTHCRLNILLIDSVTPHQTE